jgi:predicted metal-binding membrane protein
VLIAAAFYQLTPLKHVCLAKCRTPFGFIMTSWRDGASGALRMDCFMALTALAAGCCLSSCVLSAS